MQNCSYSGIQKKFVVCPYSNREWSRWKENLAVLLKEIPIEVLEYIKYMRWKLIISLDLEFVCNILSAAAILYNVS